MTNNRVLKRIPGSGRGLLSRRHRALHHPPERYAATTSALDERRADSGPAHAVVGLSRRDESPLLIPLRRTRYTLQQFSRPLDDAVPADELSRVAGVQRPSPFCGPRLNLARTPGAALLHPLL